MHKKAIVHILTKARMESDAFISEINAMEDLSEKYWIKNIIFYKWDLIKFDALISKLEKFHILCKNYSNKEDLKDQVNEIHKKFKILFVNTPLELLVWIANEVMNSVWLKVTDNSDIFRNKFLQRELIQEYNPELGIKFIKWTHKNLDVNEISKEIGFPFIIKPVNWVLSSWVAKIRNAKEFDVYQSEYSLFHDKLLATKWIDVKELLVEEFIDWEFYSIDYFVNSKWIVSFTAPMRWEHWINIGVNDYFHFSGTLSKKVLDRFKDFELEKFIKDTVKACGIRNTFIHHEFKINTKLELKTIELNGRIWGKRLEIYKECFGSNLYELILWEPFKEKLLCNYILFSIFSTKEWILTGFSENIIKNIESRKTVFQLNKNSKLIWKEIWLTKNWFWNVGHIFLKWKSLKDLEEDYSYIKKIYKKILIVEKEEKKGKKEKKSIFKKIKGIFKK